MEKEEVKVSFYLKINAYTPCMQIIKRLECYLRDLGNDLATVCFLRFALYFTVPD
jgi:hypothetical protein